MATWFRFLILLPALGPLAYYCAALYAARSYLRWRGIAPANDAKFTPAVRILNPVRGVDRQAYENFASKCDLDYPEYEILFAVGEEDNPAIPLIQKLQRDFPATPIHLILGVEQIGVSGKTNNLCRLVREAKHELLVINDSDVRVEKNYLHEVVAPFADPKVGVVTAFFRGLTQGGWSPISMRWERRPIRLRARW